MQLERINYPALAAPVGPYVHAVKHQHTLYLSGLTAFGSAAQGQPVAQQAAEIFRQIAAIAAAEGSDLGSLIKVTAFVTSFDDIDSLRLALFEIYQQRLPASSLVQVAALFSPAIDIEIEAILALPR
ncbi:RidA family protein [Oceanobacter mangrovi]|uniref:RidA family protein n=1 Tax=Oceanobacter mangrovi TaxID=2862510 RepID=UPI001C8DFF83|nr:RidA family protein [Oceanobacter mangrovi]